ncbi:hypothetical protein L804_02827 [Cryptococcus deuterogattii 2001/935-1]|nr:hypothetical protein L804_02827 [Cryptococcus deuterogattii 2001/935-1]
MGMLSISFLVSTSSGHLTVFAKGWPFWPTFLLPHATDSLLTSTANLQVPLCKPSHILTAFTSSRIIPRSSRKSSPSSPPNNRFIRLNEKWCKLLRFEEVQRGGFKALRTVLNGKEKRKFLKGSAVRLFEIISSTTKPTFLIPQRGLNSSSSGNGNTGHVSSWQDNSLPRSAVGVKSMMNCAALAPTGLNAGCQQISQVKDPVVELESPVGLVGSERAKNMKKNALNSSLGVGKIFNSAFPGMQKSITIELVKARESTGDLEVREKKKEVGCATNEERLLNDAEWRQRREYFARYIKKKTLRKG